MQESVSSMLELVYEKPDWGFNSEVFGFKFCIENNMKSGMSCHFGT